MDLEVLIVGLTVCAFSPVEKHPKNRAQKNTFFIIIICIST